MPVRIVEGQLPYTGGTGIEIDSNKVISLLLREENNLIMVNNDNEVYTDLQLQSGLTPNSDFPVGVTVGKVLQSDGWTQSGLILNWKTTSGDYARWVYATDGELYFDKGTGVRNQVYYSSEVDALLAELDSKIDEVADSIGDGQLTIQKNSTTVGTFTANQKLDTVVDIEVPSVIDNLTSTDTTNALSAYQGRVLKDMISSASGGLGRFLSLWNSSTGMPISFPLSIPYTYGTGDWFLVEVTGTTNYMPTGSSYTGTASTVVDSNTVEKGDVYIYDGNEWLLQKNTAVEVSFSNITGQPSDNTALASALNAKANDSDVVKLTGNQTVSGVKTFNSSPSVPTPTNNSDVATKKYVDERNLKSFGAFPGSGVADLQALYDWLVDGNYAQVTYQNQVYIFGPTNVTTGDVESYVMRETDISSNESGVLDMKDTILTFSVSDGTVTGNYGASSTTTGQGRIIYVNSTAGQPSNPQASSFWYDTTNNKLKVYDGTNWNEVGKEYTAGTNIQISSSNVISAIDTKYNAGEGIEIGTVQDYSAMQGPAPEGFHVPSNNEWVALCGILTSTFSMASNATTMGTYLKMPMTGYRNYSSSNVVSQGTYGHYWSSTAYSEGSSYLLYFSSSTLAQRSYIRAHGFSVRCFKDFPVIPNSSWTTLYQGSGSSGVFRNSSLGLISVSGDGITWYTIQDKNLGATTVYNNGDTLSEANCGKYFQWGNNYGFPFSGDVTTSSTQVDASGYGPGNYYSSDTFIIRSASPYDWSSSNNDNLRGGVTGVVTLDNAITNTGVLSVNGQTGDVTIETFQLAPNSPLSPKYRRYGTQAQYDALTQYYTDEEGDTVYYTI